MPIDIWTLRQCLKPDSSEKPLPTIKAARVAILAFIERARSEPGDTETAIQVIDVVLETGSRADIIIASDEDGESIGIMTFVFVPDFRRPHVVLGTPLITERYELNGARWNMMDRAIKMAIGVRARLVCTPIGIKETLRDGHFYSGLQFERIHNYEYARTM
jgi:hypothetical protein